MFLLDTTFPSSAVSLSNPFEEDLGTTVLVCSEHNVKNLGRSRVVKVVVYNANVILNCISRVW